MTSKAQTNDALFQVAVLSDELAKVRNMKQSKTHSAIEAITNILVGFGISILVTVAILPIWGFHPTTGQAVEIAAIFSVISIIRSYILRRLFTRIIQ